MATTTEDKIRDEIICALEETLNKNDIFTPEFLAKKFMDLDVEDRNHFYKIVKIDKFLW